MKTTRGLPNIKDNLRFFVINKSRNDLSAPDMAKLELIQGFQTSSSGSFTESLSFQAQIVLMKNLAIGVSLFITRKDFQVSSKIFQDKKKIRKISLSTMVRLTELVRLKNIHNIFL